MQNSMRLKNEIELVYLKVDDLSSYDYIEFIQRSKEDNAKEFLNRMRWYFQRGNFQLLVARMDGQIVGQSCAHSVVACIHGERKQITWGNDNWVLESMRGHGIGKLLQSKLHENCENFTSASYSPTNGHIKRKCGSKEIFSYSSAFYPVSRYASIVFSLGIKKLFSRKFDGISLRIPNLYYYLNRVFTSHLKDYVVREIAYQNLTEDVTSFINSNLKDRDFFVPRSLEYLKWKYGKDGFKYVMLEVVKQNKREALVAFRYPCKAKIVLVNGITAKILDMIIDKQSILTIKDLLLIVMKYCEPMHIDGIISLQDIPYYPKLVYPYPRSYVLSTLKLDHPIVNPYLSGLDQDMENC
jgi:GNAT superfamily N-acetyltransferase